jgi:hypothetical protein
MSARLMILDEIRAVAAQLDKTLAPLTDELPLLDSGLDSLCFAVPGCAPRGYYGS